MNTTEAVRSERDMSEVMTNLVDAQMVIDQVMSDIRRTTITSSAEMVDHLLDIRGKVATAASSFQKYVNEEKGE